MTFSLRLKAQGFTSKGEWRSAFNSSPAFQARVFLNADIISNMEPRYDHGKHEEKIYSLWENGGWFTPSTRSAVRLSSPSKSRSGQALKPFTIIMPPPNANDSLHLGHARFIAIQDILTRYHRMLGEPTLWLPGADHAGIETQFVFEKRLKEKGKSRFDFDRETLYKMIWDHVQEYKGVMESQLRRLGASCDWTRNKFTLDPDIITIVYKTFKKLYDDGLVYRGEKLVNYCTRCSTGYSNLEVDYVERIDPLYYIKYGPFVLATVRPETKFGDTALAVNPKDRRYKKYVGETIEAQGLLGKFKLKVVADSAVDPEFGTGVVKVTPAHDPVDFEMGERHNLEVKQVIDLNGRLNKKAGKYQGLTINEARKVVSEDLAKAGLLEKVDETYKHSVGICYRCKTVIEPMLMEQWFVKIKPLAKEALLAMKKKRVVFTAKRFEKIATHWLKNLRDWNISRQIVWGMRIPAWKCVRCAQDQKSDGWIITDGKRPEKCPNCNSTDLVQDQDTFDTWFSSGQWPFATLLSGSNSKIKMPNSKFIDENPNSDFNYFYPTSVMETAYEILPFWVIRMIMLGLYVTGEVPFKEVLIHGLVRDKQGQKISKSKGNVIDPLVMAERYGADALRMGIIWGALVETDISLSEDNIRGQRNFANKIWNIARFVLQDKSGMQNAKRKTQNLDDKWILEELGKTVGKTTNFMETYRLNEAAEEIYEFVWHKLADQYIEKVKSRREDAQPTLLFVLQESLKLLHPFMPFVTEVIWQEAKRVTSDEKQVTSLFQEESLIIAPWPKT